MESDLFSQDTANNPLPLVENATFPSEVLAFRKLALVVFLARWSKPCHVIKPIIDEIAARSPHACVVKVNANESPQLSLWLGVQNIPSILCFREGRLVGRLVGTASKDAILDLLVTSGLTDPGRNQPEEGGAR